MAYWMEGFKDPAIAEEAHKIGEDAAVYFFISALIYDLKKLPEDRELSPNRPIDLYNATGVLGEIPIEATEHLDAVVEQLVPALEKCIADGTISARISIDVLLATLLNGLNHGFIREHAGSAEYPWFEGQRKIAATLAAGISANAISATINQ